MTKEEIIPCLGKYIQLIFTLKHNKFKTVHYFELYGHIIKIEDKNVLFKDNYNHGFIVPIARIKSIMVEKRRRKPIIKKK